METDNGTVIFGVGITFILCIPTLLHDEPTPAATAVDLLD